jgi:hypothetical protein
VACRGGAMTYRIQIFQANRKLLELTSNRPLPDTKEEAVDAIDMLKGDYALILDADFQVVDRMKRSA